MNSEYFKLDVNIGDHAKVVDLGDTAFRLYVLSIGYANRHLTDGFIATAIARRMVDPDPHGLGWTWQRHAEELIAHRLWTAVDGGYQIHDFTDHNTTKDERLRKRQQDTERKAAWRAEQRSGRRAAQTRPTGQNNGVPPSVPRDSSVPSERSHSTGAGAGHARGPRPRATPDDSGNDNDNVSDSGTATAGAVTDVSDGTRADARSADDPSPPTAKALTAEHVGRCKAPPPRRVIDHIGREVAKLLTEGVAPDAIRAGLELLRTRAKHPSLLPALVNEHLNPPAARAGPSGRPPAGPGHVTPPAAPRCEHDQHAELCDICHPRPAPPVIPDWRAALRTAGRAPPPAAAEPEVIV